MKDEVNTKARLAFAAFLLILLVAGAVWYFVSASRYATYQLYTQDAVSGLIADAPVEFHGVNVGKVKSVRLVNPHSVGVVLSIDRGAPITSATLATITSRGVATMGFTGYVYVALEDAGTDSRPLTARPGEPYPVIAAAPSKIMTLDTTLDQVRENVQLVTNLLQSLLDKDTIVSLKQSADSLQKITEVLAENTRKLNAIVVNTEHASHRFEPLLESSQETVKTLQTEVLPELHKALSAIDDLSGAANKINRDPSILIRGTTPPKPGPGEGK